MPNGRCSAKIATRRKGAMDIGSKEMALLLWSRDGRLLSVWMKAFEADLEVKLRLQPESWEEGESQTVRIA